ncbi:MAG: hypothetical protein JWQ35_83 [Bacteriovoracaceae bacterium]|nr:hypothetical protein [Bacteriovoracaceae bacterium]
MKSSSDIKVSLFASAIRTDCWLDFYNSLKQSNRVPFEVVFVGPSRPDYKLPPHFKFIQSDFKPAQCTAIAANNCQGEMLLQVVDDLEFSPGAIDLLFDEVNKAPDIMSTCHYYYGEEDCTTGQNALGRSHDQLPLLPVCGMFRQGLFRSACGLDHRFFGVMWELDLYMRFYFEHKIKTQFVDAICKEKVDLNKGGDRLCSRSGQSDRNLFLQFWNLEDFVCGQSSLLSRKPFEPYSLLKLELNEQ